jgi:hypothetical protein
MMATWIPINVAAMGWRVGWLVAALLVVGVVVAAPPAPPYDSGT